MYFKILNISLNHHGFQYKEGLNIDILPFNPHGDCEPGGLYFTDKEHIFEYIDFGTLIADVEVPDDAQVYKNGTKWKADRIILSNIRHIKEFISSLSHEELFLIKYKQRDFTIFQFINEEQTRRIWLYAIKENSIRYVKEQTPENQDS